MRIREFLKRLLPFGAGVAAGMILGKKSDRQVSFEENKFDDAAATRLRRVERQLAKIPGARKETAASRLLRSLKTPEKRE